MKKLAGIVAAAVCAAAFCASTPATAQISFGFGFGDHWGGYHGGYFPRYRYYHRPWHPYYRPFLRPRVYVDVDRYYDYDDEYGYRSNGHVARCEARYRSYDPETDMFLGYDGDYHYCRL